MTMLPLGLSSLLMRMIIEANDNREQRVMHEFNEPSNLVEGVDRI